MESRPTSWDVLASGDDELELAGSDGHRRLRIDIGLRARPTRNELVLAGSRATARVDLFHGYAVLEAGGTSRTAKAAAPLRAGTRLLWAAGTNLARRAVRARARVPGLARADPPLLRVDRGEHAAADRSGRGRGGGGAHRARRRRARPPGVSGRGVPRRVLGLVETGDRPPRWGIVALLLGVALVLRVIGVGQDFWIDETATAVTYLRLPWWKAIQTYRSANQHLLYSVLGSLSFAAFGESEAAARLPAVVFGTLGVGALYFLGRMVAPERQAIAASALLAVSYHHVWFSQSARGYTGMIFFVGPRHGVLPAGARRQPRPRLGRIRGLHDAGRALSHQHRVRRHGSGGRVPRGSSHAGRNGGLTTRR